MNGGDWGCIVHDLETIRVFVLHALNFIPQWSPLTNPAKVTDSTTVTLTPGEGATAIKVESSA